MKKVLLAIVIVTVLCGAVEARRDKESRGNVYNERYEETGHWRYNNNRKEVVLYDKQYKVKGYVNPKSGKIYDDKYNEVGNVNRGW